jgi:hypothetical protein
MGRSPKRGSQGAAIQIEKNKMRPYYEIPSRNSANSTDSLVFAEKEKLKNFWLQEAFQSNSGLLDIIQIQQNTVPGADKVAQKRAIYASKAPLKAPPKTPPKPRVFTTNAAVPRVASWVAPKRGRSSFSTRAMPKSSDVGSKAVSDLAMHEPLRLRQISVAQAVPIVMPKTRLKHLPEVEPECK